MSQMSWVQTDFGPLQT